jgi:DNA-binding MarR family transcriptional regulator
VVKLQTAFDPKSYKTDPGSKIVFLLDKLTEGMRAAFWNTYSSYRLSPIQLKFLIYLFYHCESERTVSNLARQFNLTKATVSEAVSSLEKKSWIARKSLRTDKRIRRIFLTGKGRNLAKNAAGFASMIFESVGGISDSQKGLLLKSLMDVLANLSKKGIISPLKICAECRFFEIKPDSKETFLCKKRKRTLKARELAIDCSNFEERTKI